MDEKKEEKSHTLDEITKLDFQFYLYLNVSSNIETYLTRVFKKRIIHFSRRIIDCNSSPDCITFDLKLEGYTLPSEKFWTRKISKKAQEEYYKHHKVVRIFHINVVYLKSIINDLKLLSSKYNISKCNTSVENILIIQKIKSTELTEGNLSSICKMFGFTLLKI